MVCEQVHLGGIHLIIPPRDADNAAPDPVQSVTVTGQGEGKAGLMDSSTQSGREEVSGNGGNRGDETVVGGEIGPVNLLPQPSLGASGDPEYSVGM